MGSSFPLFSPDQSTGNCLLQELPGPRLGPRAPFLAEPPGSRVPAPALTDSPSSSFPFSPPSHPHPGRLQQPNSQPWCCSPPTKPEEGGREAGNPAREQAVGGDGACASFCKKPKSGGVLVLFCFALSYPNSCWSKEEERPARQAVSLLAGSPSRALPPFFSLLLHGHTDAEGPGQPGAVAQRQARAVSWGSGVSYWVRCLIQQFTLPVTTSSSRGRRRRRILTLLHVWALSARP